MLWCLCIFSAREGQCAKPRSVLPSRRLRSPLPLNKSPRIPKFQIRTLLSESSSFGPLRFSWRGGCGAGVRRGRRRVDDAVHAGAGVNAGSLGSLCRAAAHGKRTRVHQVGDAGAGGGRRRRGAGRRWVLVGDTAGAVWHGSLLKLKVLQAARALAEWFQGVVEHVCDVRSSVGGAEDVSRTVFGACYVMYVRDVSCVGWGARWCEGADGTRSAGWPVPCGVCSWSQCLRQLHPSGAHTRDAASGGEGGASRWELLRPVVQDLFRVESVTYQSGQLECTFSLLPLSSDDATALGDSVMATPVRCFLFAGADSFDAEPVAAGDPGGVFTIGAKESAIQGRAVSLVRALLASSGRGSCPWRGGGVSAAVRHQGAQEAGHRLRPPVPEQCYML